MTDLHSAEEQWHTWIWEACAVLDVDPALVDVAGIHALTKEIAHGFSRPMAPVGAFILGMAVASHPNVPRDELLRALENTVAAAGLPQELTTVGAS